MNIYYTYAFLRRDGTPYYIGKGCRKRWRTRYGRAIKAPDDDKYIIKLKTGLTEEEAFKHERYMIAILPNLHNLTEGGEGPSGYRHTEETKEKLRGPRDEAFRELRRKLTTGVKRGRYEAWGTDEERRQRRLKRNREAQRRYMKRKRGLDI